MRFEPSQILARTGLSAFTCTRLRCVSAIQARTFREDQLRAGLLHDRQLPRAFPGDLFDAQKATLGTPAIEEALGENRYSVRGYLIRNRYDIGRERPGYRFRRQIHVLIERRLPNHAGETLAPTPARGRNFEKTVRLHNRHSVTPPVILMPIQPRALHACRAAGFQPQLDAYLEEAQERCRFRVLEQTP